MLPSSVRRVASAIVPQTSSPLLASLALGAAYSRPVHRHQRRCSSSKPSSPANGPKDNGSQVPTTEATSSSAGQPGRKRKAKAQPPVGPALPSVPSTQHLPPESLALSSFFSLHRPISITHSLPWTITDDAFASIFKPRTQGQKANDVMVTLSNAVKDLEAPMDNLSLGGMQDQMTTEHQDVHKLDLKHADGTESSIYVQLNAMSGHFLPYSPPPAPEASNPAMYESIDDVAASAAGEVAEATQTRTYKAILTIEEQTDAEGNIQKITAHSPRVLEDQPQPRSFLERVAVRYLRYEDAQRHRDVLHAISVMRRRKLKMKKKKFKKLMKKTRVERRKLDRA